MIYFVSNGRAIKIGYSKTVGSRFRSLQTSSSEELDFLGSAEGGKPEERFLHKRLGSHRLKGEWFVDCPEVREVMADVLAGKFAFQRPNNTGSEPQPCSVSSELLERLMGWSIETFEAKCAELDALKAHRRRMQMGAKERCRSDRQKAATT